VTIFHKSFSHLGTRVVVDFAGMPCPKAILSDNLCACQLSVARPTVTTVQSINPAGETLSSFVEAAKQELEIAFEEAIPGAGESDSDGDETARNIGARFLHKFEGMVQCNYFNHHN
jgi:hypothetical protein